jgi:hypothetical protein
VDLRLRLAVAVLVLTTVLPGPAAGQSGADGLRLVWCDPSQLALGTAGVARAEASALLERLGARVAWRSGPAGQVRRSGEVWVVLLGEAPASVSPHVLGATPRRHQEAPVVWVRVPHVSAAVGVRRAAGLVLPPGDRLRVGVALGRVIAHEVVHALVPTLPHGSGLMSDVLGRRELTAARIAVDSDVTLAFRAALRGDPVRVAPASGMLSAQAPSDWLIR